MSNSKDRALREKETYDKGLERSIYNSIFSHCTYFTNLMKEQYLINEMKNHVNGKVLEIGCDCWYGWLHNMQLTPKEIHCINISETELEKGSANLGKSSIVPQFHVMDAHKLEFPDNHFDLVFGGALLHHLDLPTAMSEINRVLKPGGKMVFWEPLGLNPVAKLVRLVTPAYRTKDEKPFGIGEIKVVKSFFTVRMIPFELFVTPVGVLSRLLFKNPVNWLMKSTYAVDRFLLRIIPPLKYLYRYMILVGEKKDL